jgi:hypothetical protein
LIYFFAAEQYGVMSAIPAKPIEVKNYVKHCDQRRKFPVLYKVEFQVSKKKTMLPDIKEKLKE